MGIFLVFSVMSFVALILGRRGLERSEASVGTGLVLERTGAAAALMPLLFAMYLASVPRLAVDPALLFGFLLLLDVGLLAIAIVTARRVVARGRRGDHAGRVRHLDRQRTRVARLTMASIFNAIFVVLLSASANDRRAAEEAVRGHCGSGDLCGADSAVRVSGAGANRTRCRVAVDVVRHDVRAARADRLARTGHPRLAALLCRGVLRAGG